MPPSCSNTFRADSRLRSQALGAGIALTLMCTGALADEAHRFVFTAFSDAAGGSDVVAGRYSVALEELKSDSRRTEPDSSSVNTNRCVAYSMTLQWGAARTACDAAVRAAAEQRRRPPAGWSLMHTSADDYLAVAYANRAVLHWMAHDEAAAGEDLLKARQLSPDADFVARNLAALEVHGEQARAKAHGEVALAGAAVPQS